MPKAWYLVGVGFLGEVDALGAQLVLHEHLQVQAARTGHLASQARPQLHPMLLQAGTLRQLGQPGRWPAARGAASVLPLVTVAGAASFCRQAGEVGSRRARGDSGVPVGQAFTALLGRDRRWLGRMSGSSGLRVRPFSGARGLVAGAFQGGPSPVAIQGCPG